MRTAVLEKLAFNNEVAVMEDDKQTLDAVRRALNEFGAHVTVAKNENEAVRLAKQRKIRSYILDVNMGSADRSQEGLNALERLKAFDHGIFVGILTGYSQFRQQAEKLSADYFREKTRDRKADVRHTVVALLRHREAEIAAARRLLSMGPGETDVKPYSSLDPMADPNFIAYAKKKKDAEWMAKHEEMFVCFVDGHLVGSNQEEASLVAEMRRRFSDKPRFIAFVGPDEESIDFSTDLTVEDN